MSDTSFPYADRLNLAETVARIERQQAETRKFVAEHDKLAAEREKLAAEAAKLDRDRSFAPWQVVATLMGAGAALFGAGAAFVKVFGG